MLIAHQIALDLNNVRATYMARATGTARFAYNWALAEWQRQYEAHRADESLPKPGQLALRRQLNAIKREQFPGLLEVTKNAPQMAIIQLGQAFANFLAGRARYPKFRKRGVHDRFTLTNDQIHSDDRRIRSPKLGWVRMREPLRFVGYSQSATVCRVADRWFVSLTVDTPAVSHLPPAENQGGVGVDLGVSACAALSTGEVKVGPKPHKALLKRLRRLSRSLSRKQKGSANRRKAKAKLARLPTRSGNIRNDAQHKLTTDLTRRFHTIGIEDLNVRGMMATRHLARSIADMGFHECRQQLEYKAALRGGVVIVADRWFASSKTCSGCGMAHDRDVNAALNLKNYAVSSTVSACGGEGSGLGVNAKTKPVPRSSKSALNPFRRV